MSAQHTMQDEAAIRQLIKDVVTAWNNADGHAFARIFTEDGEFRGVFGEKVKGRANIAQNHQHLFDGMLRGSTLSSEIDGIRFIRPDVAYVETINHMRHDNNPFPQEIGTVVLVKENGEWRAVSYNGAGIPQMPEGQA